jgi:hypothetical protein
MMRTGQKHLPPKVRYQLDIKRRDTQPRVCHRPKRWGAFHVKD